MGKLKKILKKSKEIVDKAKVKKKRLTAQQKRDREKIAILTATAPPLLGATYMSSKGISDEKVRQKDAYLAKQEREKEAAKKKKENKKTKPKKMKAGGMALRGHGKAFLKGKK